MRWGGRGGDELSGMNRVNVARAMKVTIFIAADHVSRSGRLQSMRWGRDELSGMNRVNVARAMKATIYIAPGHICRFVRLQ